MDIPDAASWFDVTPKEAVAIQRELASAVVSEPLSAPPRRVAGIDCAVSPARGRCYATVVLWDVDEARIIETSEAERALEFPYIPGLLSFREIPVILDALRALAGDPEVLICDGQGYAHPRRFGLACHLGVLVGRPSCGCAKSRLVGSHDEPGSLRGSHAPLTDRGEVIGEVLRTRDRVKPVFVSVGHLIDLSDAVELILSCTAGYRLPEPTRQADRLVGLFKRRREAMG